MKRKIDYSYLKIKSQTKSQDAKIEKCHYAFCRRPCRTITTMLITTKRKIMRKKTKTPKSISQIKMRPPARRGNLQTDGKFTALTRTRSVGTGPVGLTSCCQCWDTVWGWETFGGSLTCVTVTVEGRSCCHL